MARCTKCGYLLVLLPKRAKYKCAKCGSLFPQKQIDNKEFRTWNQRQRQEDKEQLKPKKRIKLTEEERLQRIQEIRKKWRERNKDKINAKNRELWHNGTRKQYQREYYKKDIQTSRLGRRIKYYRLRQKALALKELKNIGKTAYDADFFISPPTSVLADLLKQ